MNKAIRTRAIQTIVNSWIENEDESNLGALLSDRSFDDLVADVSNLRKLGRSANWQTGIDQWLSTINLAGQTFSNNTGVSLANACRYGVDHWRTEDSSTEFTRLIKWAVMQGSTFAWCEV